jgi:hypothetical protein
VKCWQADVKKVSSLLTEFFGGFLSSDCFHILNKCVLVIITPDRVVLKFKFIEKRVFITI